MYFPSSADTISPSVTSTAVLLFSCGNLMSAGLANAYMDSYVATTALLLSQNGLRSNLRASNFLKNFLGEHAPDRPSYVPSPLPKRTTTTATTKNHCRSCCLSWDHHLIPVLYQIVNLSYKIISCPKLTAWHTYMFVQHLSKTSLYMYTIKFGAKVVGWLSCKQ